MSKTKVILDTNFLLLPGQFKLDVFSEIKRIMDDPYELCVLEGTLEELERLAEGNSKDAHAAKLGFVLAKEKGLKTMRGSKDHVDDDLVDMAGDNVIIATQDSNLKKRVKKKGGRVITMRQKQHLIKE